MNAESRPEREVTAPRRILSTSSAGRALTIVETLLGDAARRGERAVAWTRLTIGVTALVLWPMFAYEDLLVGRLSAWVTLCMAPVGIAVSVVVLTQLKTRSLQRGMQLASAALDVLLVAIVLLPYPFSPGPGYYNAINLSGMALIVLGTVAGGARLSRRVSIYSTAMHLALLWTLASIDYRLGHVGGILFDYSLYTVYVGAAGVLAWSAASRTRELVLAAATQTLAHERARGLLGAYVSEEVAEASLAADEIRLGGQKQQVAVLFSDLRGFTSYSEGLPPEEIVLQLNRYLEVMVACIRAQGGVVDKYIGDAIMAVFGAPVSRDDDAARAIRAAATMRAALVLHNYDRKKRGQPPLAQGIGVHFGTVVAGNVGTRERAAYTVIGDTVNLASRLESATKEQAVEILLSEDVVKAAQRTAATDELPRVREAGTLKVRGREQAVRTYRMD